MPCPVIPEFNLTKQIEGGENTQSQPQDLIWQDIDATPFWTTRANQTDNIIMCLTFTEDMLNQRFWLCLYLNMTLVYW